MDSRNYKVNNLYVYKKIKGDVFSENKCIYLLATLLDKMQKEFGVIVEFKRYTNIDNLTAFYKLKTFKRVREYFSRFEMVDGPISINGLECEPIIDSLKNLKWEKTIKKSILGRFHGDFHNENILINSDGKFTLLDWRQNFGDGQFEFGDVYYDLAKYYHGLIVNHGIVSKGLYSIEYSAQSQISINVHIPLNNYLNIRAFEQWTKDNYYELDHIKLLTALIFLNIACLHEPPYSHFLFALGRFELKRVTSD